MRATVREPRLRSWSLSPRSTRTARRGRSVVRRAWPRPRLQLLPEGGDRLKVEFYYSSKDNPSDRFPVSIDDGLKGLKELDGLGVKTEAVDVSKLDDVFRLYHKALVGPSAAKRAVFGMKGALEADFGRSCPALFVYEDAGDRYPTDAYPRSDRELGLIGIEAALDELIAAQRPAAEAGGSDRRVLGEP